MFTKKCVQACSLIEVLLVISKSLVEFKNKTVLAKIDIETLVYFITLVSLKTELEMKK